MRLKDTSVFSALALDETQDVNKWVQVLRVGKFQHPQYGAFEITTQVLSEMKANFDNKIRGIDIAWDYFHESDKEASGWPIQLELREGDSGTELWAETNWTVTAARKLKERELRYFSPDFAFQWSDPETGVVHNNVLFGGALTNRPFVKEMQAIVANELQTQGERMTELEKAQAKIKELEATHKKLSEDYAAAQAKLATPPPPPAGGDNIEELKKQIETLKAELAKAQGDNQTMMAEKAKAEEAKQMAEKENAFNKLLTEGKACAAQKDAFVKGDMNEFIKLAQPVNLNARGTSTSGDVADDDVKSILKLAEEKIKANPKLNKGDAISLAKKELKK